MTDKHPITPPLELVQQWADMLSSRSDHAVFSLAARWGADQELEACCEWLVNSLSEDPQEVSQELRARRRPKSLTLPLTLKDQALALLEIQHGIDVEDLAFIRRALEALPND
jgi:hypothetical protein